jgi:uncharacterized protein YcbX
MQLTTIYRYPVKSCRGESVDWAVVEAWGLGGDRRWMLADLIGETITAREQPRMLLITPELTDDGLWLRAPEKDDLFVPTPGDSTTTVSVHNGTPFLASEGAREAGRWLTDFLGIPARLVFTDDPTRRRLNPRFAREDDSVSFADAYPLLVATEESLAQLNQWIADGPLSAEGPLDMRRFRPNVVVRGAAAFSEDAWRRIRIGDATFRAPKGCDRCVLTTTDPDTGARGKEPIATLARHRRWDGATWFAMNLIPDTPGARIAVGDEVEVLETAESDGPPR